MTRVFVNPNQAQDNTFNFYTLVLIITFFTNSFDIPLRATDLTYSSNTTLSNALTLSLATRAVFNATLTLTGGGFVYQLPSTPDPVFIINAGYSITFKNILLRYFSDAHLSLGTGSNVIFGTGTVVHTLTDQTLTHTLQFGTNSTWIGSNNNIDLGTGQILVTTGGSLTIANMNLINVCGTNIGCADNTGSIKFENVTISTPNNWRWNNGSFSVAQNVEFAGGIFTYTSGMTSTVLSSSRLLLSKGVTFSYDPTILSGLATASPLNLNFTDTSSWLTLNNCNLCVTTTGLQLLKGSLEVIGKNYLYSDATTSTMPGLIFGDASSYYNDFQVQKFTSNLASLDVKKGFLAYKNCEA